ncbi:MAG: hypothetical protein NUV45_06795 [Tepidanaerobacteraceae bacterium]|jgi:uncharacterized protein YneF (UPF0154 family)|nr:hypothetical protein [Tepidanaerobacteraceae bacterium]
MSYIYYIISGIIIGAIITVSYLRYIKKLKTNKRINRAKKSEIKAVELLKKNGFEIIDIQKENTYTVFVDDKPYKATVKADMIVKKGNKTFVAEVKSGESAPSLKSIDTRRQLLEYYLVYKPGGLLLIDMEKNKIRKVEYSIANDEHPFNICNLVWCAVFLFAGFVIGFLSRSG